jgi:hypothetical protein
MTDYEVAALRRLQQRGFSNYPSTVEEMVKSIQLLLEEYPDGLAPYPCSIVPTHKLFLDIAQRIIYLEKRQNDNLPS